MQKHIVRSCVRAGVPVITATQMMESMITAPSPTRAEVSDVANAVFDGTDALMLSGETAIGTDPVNVVRTMARVAERAERDANYAQWADLLGREQRSSFPEGPDRITMAITHAAGLAATDAGAHAILCCTRSGRTALAMARFRPAARLIGLSPDATTSRALALSWASVRCRSPHTRPPTNSSGTPSSLPFTTTSFTPARPCWCWPERPTAQVVPRPTCCVSSASNERRVGRGGR